MRHASSTTGAVTTTVSDVALELVRQREDVERDHRGDAHQRGDAELAGEEFAVVHGGIPPGPMLMRTI